MQLPLIGKVNHPLPWVAGLVAAGVISVGVMGLVIFRHSAPKLDLAKLTVPVVAQDLTVRISASGTVVPRQTVNLSPKTSGRLAKLYVEQGDSVRQGQIIAQMDNEDAAALLAQTKGSFANAMAHLAEIKAGSRSEEIAQAQAAVQQAQAQVREAASRLNLAMERVRRNKLLAAEGAIARDRLDEVLNESRNAQAGLDLAQARVKETQERLDQTEVGNRREQIDQAQALVAEARGRLQAIEVQMEDTVIRAPFDGVITQRYADPGDFVTPTTSASSTASATSSSIVALASGLEVLAKVPEVDISQIRVGQPVEISADAYPTQVFKGVVRLIAPEAVVEQNVTSFQVRIDIQTGRQQLRSGMNVDMSFLGDRLKNALVVPTVAVVTQAGQLGVLVPGRDDQPEFKPVTTGPNIGNQIQLLGGIQAGERVFVELPAGKKLEDFTKTKQLE
ncbi:RND transporter [Neosynechococcus sphagnicola sy1]|uniref:RND transporter n=1 Tax=Neosynechococcus sphagnicola sy1 TaxID=1497020 RepID=A0A098TJY2_9CYAN|nr:efflux RND transporter periplasmic adaptor subunit [Neosynechococcus sphagnicola]KGF72650.1 RND transporter [Neosynechococcus sphagnicola sy1]